MIKKQVKDAQGVVTYWISNNVRPEKETLFFLHGLTADHTMFEQQIRCFDKGFNIIAWDAPAHGESRPYSPFTYENAAKAMYRILEDNAVDKVILIGQSMGGFLSQSFIRRYPDRVKGFTAIDSAPFGRYYSRSDIWWLKQIEWMSRLFPAGQLKSAMAKQNAQTEYGRQNMRKMLESYEKGELCHLMGIGYAGFLEDNCELDIACPTILLVGENDTTGKVKAYNKAWSERTGFPLVWIPNAAHNSNVDNPNAVNRAIEEFLASIT